MNESELLISASELAALLSNPNLRVIDCRWALTNPSFGREEFDKGHIPSAQFMPLEPAMSDEAGERGRHPLPDKERFAATLGAYGIDSDSSVIAYDDGSCSFACRFWWMMRWVGHADVRVLDGGLHQWTKQGLETAVEAVQAQPCQFEVRPSLTKDCGPDDVLGVEHKLIDARGYDRFLGQNESIDHTAGHIPGAMCYPFDGNQGTDKRFKRETDRFQTLGADESIVCYCGSGVTATNNIMALLLAGYPEPTLYPGSWSEWIEDPNRPIEREEGSPA